MYEPHQIQQQDVLIHHPIIRCAYNDGVADNLVVSQVSTTTRRPYAITPRP
ncbi:hypothetical protein [Pseudomonas indica]|uniref:hypothetical protein n=1 Tax=Pseudomonas indica TaxID=137658 RepID=UPI0023F6CBEC|nr:hypothetical protein [Pseudomonas indica]